MPLRTPVKEALKCRRKIALPWPSGPMDLASGEVGGCIGRRARWRGGAEWVLAVSKRAAACSFTQQVV